MYTFAFYARFMCVFISFFILFFSSFSNFIFRQAHAKHTADYSVSVTLLK